MAEQTIASLVVNGANDDDKLILATFKKGDTKIILQKDFWHLRWACEIRTLIESEYL